MLFNIFVKSIINADWTIHPLVHKSAISTISTFHEYLFFASLSISKQIAEARDKGDLSENAEYDAAKEAQGLLEMKISELEYKLEN